MRGKKIGKDEKGRMRKVEKKTGKGEEEWTRNTKTVIKIGRRGEIGSERERKEKV